MFSEEDLSEIQDKAEKRSCPLLSVPGTCPQAQQAQQPREWTKMRERAATVGHQNKLFDVSFQLGTSSMTPKLTGEGDAAEEVKKKHCNFRL